MTYCPILKTIPILCVASKGAYCSIIPGLSHDVNPIYMFWLNFVSHAFFNKTLSPVWYTWDCLRRFSFWMNLFINACLYCLINCQLASWLILRIVSLPNTNYDGVCCVVVCLVDRMANIVDERTPSQEFSLSKSISWILQVRIILPIVWFYLSTIAFACWFITLMELHGIP